MYVWGAWVVCAWGGIWVSGGGGACWVCVWGGYLCGGLLCLNSEMSLPSLYDLSTVSPPCLHHVAQFRLHIHTSFPPVPLLPLSRTTQAQRHRCTLPRKWKALGDFSLTADQFRGDGEEGVVHGEEGVVQRGGLLQ